MSKDLKLKPKLAEPLHKHAGGAPKGSRNQEIHGLSSAKAYLRRWRSRAIDKRTSTVYALKQWRKEILDDFSRRHPFPLEPSVPTLEEPLQMFIGIEIPVRNRR
jgi:hypothetical protein